MICVAQLVFLFFQSEKHPISPEVCIKQDCIKRRLLQSWNFPYLYNILTYFAYIDGISHSFKHALHDKQGVKVI